MNLRSRVLNDGEKNKLFVDLDLEGCLNLGTDLAGNLSVASFAAKCDVGATGDRNEWTGTFRDLTGVRVDQNWPKREIILRAIHYSLNNA